MASRGDEEMNSVTFIQRQVNRMIAFIELEGIEKCEAIANNAEEEYNLTVGNLVQNGRKQLVLEYDRKLKRMRTDKNLQKQILTNESRMEIYKLRHDLVNKVVNEIEKKLHENMNDKSFSKEILHKCIMQSLVILLEKQVIIQVLERDYDDANSLLKNVKNEFKTLTGIDCEIKVSKKYLSPNQIGGCILFNKRCSFKVTNTVSERFKIFMERFSVSSLRSMLFGENQNRRFFT